MNASDLPLWCWKRASPFSPVDQAKEVWTLHRDKKIRSFDVRSTFGKKLATMMLKQSEIEHFTETIEILRKQNEFLHRPANVEPVPSCAVCGEPAQSSRPAASFFQFTYFNCPRCDHYFVNPRPKPEALRAFYKNNSEYQAMYIDPATLDIRLRDISYPKLQWVINEYKTFYSGPPFSILDVGAGSGHMVKAAADLWLDSAGVEISETGVDFAMKNFGIELMPMDFLTDSDKLQMFDLITFWGVIEHVPNPVDFLKKAVEKVSPKGMVIAEVPRWDSLSTHMQLLFPNTITRHLDPSTHIHVFTDSSLASAFVMAGLKPVAAWYFGLDVYESITQLLHHYRVTSDPAAARFVSKLQPLLDRIRLCDFMVLAGVPDRKS